MQHIPAADERFNYFAPQPVDRTRKELRLERFTRAAYDILQGQIGPLANLRSSAGCKVHFKTDSPWLVVQLQRLRHHQAGPVGVDIRVQLRDGTWVTTCSRDLRTESGDIEIRFGTGLERGGPPQAIEILLPLISTCAFAGIKITQGAILESSPAPEANWLAIGDSLTQGFSVQQPSQHWLSLLEDAHGICIQNLGVGGLRIEPTLFEPAITTRPWQGILVGLGSNHAWRADYVDMVAERAHNLASILEASGCDTIYWAIPPWKPCEEEKGPSEFWGVALDRAAGQRMQTVRSILAEVLASHPTIKPLRDFLPKDHRLYPDGLHPVAHGFASMATAIGEEISGD